KIALRVSVASGQSHNVVVELQNIFTGNIVWKPWNRTRSVRITGRRKPRPVAHHFVGKRDLGVARGVDDARPQRVEIAGNEKGLRPVKRPRRSEKAVLRCRVLVAMRKQVSPDRVSLSAAHVAGEIPGIAGEVQI